MTPLDAGCCSRQGPPGHLPMPPGPVPGMAPPPMGGLPPPALSPPPGAGLPPPPMLAPPAGLAPPMTGERMINRQADRRARPVLRPPSVAHHADPDSRLADGYDAPDCEAGCSVPCEVCLCSASCSSTVITAPGPRLAGGGYPAEGIPRPAFLPPPAAAFSGYGGQPSAGGYAQPAYPDPQVSQATLQR